MTKPASPDAHVKDVLHAYQTALSAPGLEPNQDHAVMAAHGALGTSARSWPDVSNWLLSAALREKYIRRFGFVMLTRQTLDTLARLLGNQPVLDAGAGSGYLAHQLCQRGVPVTASDIGHRSGFDFEEVFQRDHEGDSVSLLPGRFRTVLLCWPPMNGFAADVASAMHPGQVLVYQGEGRGGCTANDDFFEMVDDASRWQRMSRWERELSEHHLRFHGIHDYWCAWSRR